MTEIEMAVAEDKNMRRLLALSGGGVRGIVEVAFLEEIERVYRTRLGPQMVLSDVFDLVGGTSTGSLIAAALALGHPVSRISAFYLERAVDLFSSGKRWQLGWAPVFSVERLEAEIRREVGDMRLGDPTLHCLLAIVTKRLDTGSAWVVSNIPGAPYFDDPADGSYLGNRHYRLVDLLIASAAAPVLFRQKTVHVVDGDLPGVFVDGGLSPFNDPSLALLMLARLAPYGLRWPTGANRLFALSIGTGSFRSSLSAERAARAKPLPLAVQSFASVLGECGWLSNLLMEWIGHPLSPSRHNSEIGALDPADALFAEPPFSYLRLDIPLEAGPLAELGIDVSATDLRRFRRLDDPGIIHPLYDLAREVCRVRYDLDALLP